MNPQAVADVMAFFVEYDRQQDEGRYVEADLGAATFWPADKRLPVVSVRSLLLTVQAQAEEIERLRGQVEFRVRRDAPDTSKAVERKIREGTLQWRLLELFRALPNHGLTDDEIERNTHLTHQSVSAARNTLMRKGYIADSGQRRPTRSGNEAIVWKVVPDA